MQQNETYYPIIAEAICNAPNITSNINSNITMAKAAIGSF